MSTVFSMRVPTSQPGHGNGTKSNAAIATTTAIVQPTARFIALEPRRLSVAARVGCRDVTVVGLHDELSGAEVHVGVRHGCGDVPERQQALAQLRRSGGLEIDGAVAIDLPARRVERGLRIHA